MKNVFALVAIIFLFQGVTYAAPEAKKAKFNVNSAVKFLEKNEQILEKWGNTKVKRGSKKFFEKDKAMKKVVDELIDYRFIANYIIGKQWDQTDEDTKKKLFEKIKELFTELYLEDTFYNNSYEKKYIEKGLETMYIKGVPESVYITTEIQVIFKGKPVIYELIYHLHTVDGKYKVFDVELDTVSMVRNYREQFNKNIKDKSVKELIKKLDGIIKKKKNGKKKGSKKGRYPLKKKK